MRGNGCGDNPSGSFSGETTQIHSIPAFSSTLKVHAHWGAGLCESHIHLGVRVWIWPYIIQCSYFSKPPQEYWARLPAGICLCSLSSTKTNHNVHCHINVWDSSAGTVLFIPTALVEYHSVSTDVFS